MAWLLLFFGTSAGIGGFLSLASARLAIDKIESLLLFLIAAVLITGGSVVRAVNRSRVVLELEEAIRGRLVPQRELASRRARYEGARSGADPIADDAVPGSPEWPEPPEPVVREALWEDEEEPASRPGRMIQVLSAAVLAVTVGLLGLWLVVTTVK